MVNPAPVMVASDWNFSLTLFEEEIMGYGLMLPQCTPIKLVLFSPSKTWPFKKKTLRYIHPSLNHIIINKMFFSNYHLYDNWCVGLDFKIFIFVLSNIVKANFWFYFFWIILIPFPHYMYINDDFRSLQNKDKTTFQW